ncbi:HNH endonuclease [Amycolatopsis sp. cmx-8-4]|uniref:HNH endonuclease n=1 Tax=Amycolatopsis sp. cmx-8-4 TaxID=2790947 RepID=UPI0039794574
MPTRPCLDCHRLFPLAPGVSRCPACASVEQSGRSRKRRGHDRFRHRVSTIRLLEQATHCATCHKAFNGRMKTLGHIIPLRNGGTSIIDNYKVECEQCNYGWKRDR